MRPELLAGVVMRTFRDAAGIEWTVFEVRRSNEESNWAYLPRGFRSGWLCFESNLGKRRLSPVPDGWRTLDEEGLELMLKRASAVGRPARDRETEKWEQGDLNDERAP